MANMSYCRFENTERDMQDCLNAMCDAFEDGLDLKTFQEKLSKSERYAFKKIIQLSQDIIDTYDNLDYPPHRR